MIDSKTLPYILVLMSFNWVHELKPHKNTSKVIYNHYLATISFVVGKTCIQQNRAIFSHENNLPPHPL